MVPERGKILLDRGRRALGEPGGVAQVGHAAQQEEDARRHGNPADDDVAEPERQRAGQKLADELREPHKHDQECYEQDDGGADQHADADGELHHALAELGPRQRHLLMHQAGERVGHIEEQRRDRPVVPGLVHGDPSRQRLRRGCAGRTRRPTPMFPQRGLTRRASER
jgi:hypothetical protein